MLRLANPLVNYLIIYFTVNEMIIIIVVIIIIIIITGAKFSRDWRPSQISERQVDYMNQITS
jgi:Tfp pilus assembly protein FimT